MSDAFIYLYDPLCGWCYGASAGLRLLASRPGVAVEALPTGLFARPNPMPLSDRMAEHIWTNDRRIADLTGAVFSAQYQNLLNDRRPLDSTLATLALTAVSLTAPLRELEMLGIIQSARYVDGRDITDASVLSDLLYAANLGSAAQGLITPSPDLLYRNVGRMQRAGDLMSRVGAQGVPTLLRDEGQDCGLIDSRALYADPFSLFT